MIQAFDYADIRLADSPTRQAIDETMAFYRGISKDRFFKYMREDAGLPAPGRYYTGWFPASRGNFLIGQMISAFCRMYAFTGEEAFRAKALDFFDEYKKCYDLLTGTPKALMNADSFYDLEKLLRAILDLHIYCCDDRAVSWIPELLDFADKNLTTANLFGDNTTEWYTAAESFLAVYEVLGLPRAKELAFRYEYREFWDLFYKDLDPFSKRPVAGLYSEFVHAYSHVNSFNSCAAFYRATGDPYYLRALRRFYRFMQREEVMATGGYGANFEHLMPKYRIVDALRTGHDSFETQCDTYAAFRLSGYLTGFTGEPDCSNWVERLIFNAAIATIPMTEEGNVIYYSDYNMYGAAKINRADGWTCCTGTRPLLMLEIPRLIYFHDEESLYIAQYLPSSVHFACHGHDVCLTQSSRFPEEDTIHLELQLSCSDRFCLKFRLPDWMEKDCRLHIFSASSDEITSRCEVTVDREGWLSVSGMWENQTRLELTLPQSLSLHALDPEKNGPNAFLHGPVVLAASYTGPQTPNDRMDIRKLLPQMEPVTGKPLHYTVRDHDDISFKPFYEYQEKERYFLYHDTAAHATDRFAPRLSASGNPGDAAPVFNTQH